MNKWKILLCCSGMFKNSNLPFIQYIDIYSIEGKLSFTPFVFSFQKEWITTGAWGLVSIDFTILTIMIMNSVKFVLQH
jgi:hypothetical protein